MRFSGQSFSGAILRLCQGDAGVLYRFGAQTDASRDRSPEIYLLGRNCADGFCLEYIFVARVIEGVPT
jgi:hypothetical protein